MNRTLDQLNGLHGRMQVVDPGLVVVPDVRLVTVTAPEVISSLLPAIENGFVLALVVSATEREGVLRPDDEGGPLATCINPSLLQCVQLRRAHAHIASTLGHDQEVQAGVVEELVEPIAQGIVHDATVFAAHLVLGVVAIVHVVGWISERHVCELTIHQPLNV